VVFQLKEFLWVLKKFNTNRSLSIDTCPNTNSVLNLRKAQVEKAVTNSGYIDLALCPYHAGDYHNPLNTDPTRAFCSDEGEYFDVYRDNLIAYSISQEWIIKTLRKLFSVLTNPKHHIFNESLFYIGEFRLCNRLQSLYIFRNENYDISDLNMFFQENPPSNTGVILTSFPWEQNLCLKELLLIDIENILTEGFGLNHYELDVVKLENYWKYMNSSTPKTAYDLVYSPCFTNIHYLGHEHTFRANSNQCKFVRHLIENQYLKRLEKLGTKRILSEIGAGEQTKIHSLFKGKENWQKLIHIPQDGYCCIMPRSIYKQENK
jgi:hypothetical protein